MYAISKCLDGVGSFRLCDGNGQCPPMILIGASDPVGALSGETIHSLTVTPRKGERGMVAVASSISSRPWVGTIALEWDKDKLVIDGHAPFVGPSDRVGQAYSDGYNHWVEVQIGNDRFTSSEKRTSVACYVPDANLLCRYWTGQATVEEVKAAVKAEKMATTAKEALITEIRKHFVQASNLRQQVDELQVLLDESRHSHQIQVKSLLDKIEDLRDQRSELQDSHRRLSTKLENLRASRLLRLAKFFGVTY